jgi:hypothetical protein
VKKEFRVKGVFDSSGYLARSESYRLRGRNYKYDMDMESFWSRDLTIIPQEFI